MLLKHATLHATSAGRIYLRLKDGAIIYGEIEAIDGENVFAPDNPHHYALPGSFDYYERVESGFFGYRN